MTDQLDPDLDLRVSRVIAAPRSVVWDAWADPSKLAQWWVPAPQHCRVRVLELRPGGGFRTELSDGGAEFRPHLSACILDVVEGERIVFTDALLAGWRPSESPFMTAVITMRDHAGTGGTEYTATAMHRSGADRDKHEELGFHDGWGTVIDQLAALAESLASTGGSR